MLVIPSLDLLDGYPVTGPRGAPAADTRVKQRGKTPLDHVSGWKEDGAQLMQAIDVNRRRERGNNNELIEKAGDVIGTVPVETKEGEPVEVRRMLYGGGLRDPNIIIEYASRIARYVIIGPRIDDRGMLKELSEELGSNRLVFALDWDESIRKVKTETKRIHNIFEIGRRTEGVVGAFLLAAKAREGTERGPDISLYKMFCPHVSVPVIATGGTSSLDDIRAVRDTGAYGLVVGKALYNGRFTLREAIGSVYEPGDSLW